ncbi:coiled-coil domain-containing protein 102A-like [Branchiostoma lanceolatum]|uniref:coiled-coil domain-containing protein 102A-like n=1 Tax=Branchiostoma lanceolatum TaxID=7740 RepID=UPI003452F805
MNRNSPQKLDVSHVGATRIHQVLQNNTGGTSNSHSRSSSTSSSSSHHHMSNSLPHNAHPQTHPEKVRSNNNTSPSPHSQYPDPDWEEKEELRLRELEEARARAAQMEKTMRWWSDCTANWREKWGKVRNERNKAREENRQLRGKLDGVIKELTTTKREKQEVSVDLERLKGELEKMNTDREVASVMTDTTCGRKSPSQDVVPERDIVCEKAEKENVNEKQEKMFDNKNELHLDIEIDKPDRPTSWSGTASRSRDRAQLEELMAEKEKTEQKMCMLQMKLEESSKTIQIERDEKSLLMKEIEKLHCDLSTMKNKCEEVTMSRSEVQKELNLLKSLHQQELSRVTLDLEEESTSRSTMDKKLHDLRKEIERLQAENAQEWGKSERLETEKLALERDNKKLRTQVEDLEEQLDRKTKEASAALDSDVKSLQSQLHDRNKEVGDLKHENNKLKKKLQDKAAELHHAQKKAEQSDTEVKLLRGRVEELKKSLAQAEDEVDCLQNNQRKQQRTLEEQQEQCESLQVQVDHLQTRLRQQQQNATLPLFKKRSASSSVKSYSAPMDDGSDPLSDEDLDDSP